jgi:glycine/D-amino acid oxidase-like deaminating enzyme
MVQVVKGYYCKTPENLPLIGGAGSVEGLFICGALSGIGIMSSQAAGELAAIQVVNYISGKEAIPVPKYAKHFLPTRYSDPEFLASTQKLNAKSGQL